MHALLGHLDVYQKPQQTSLHKCSIIMRHILYTYSLEQAMGNLKLHGSLLLFQTNNNSEVEDPVEAISTTTKCPAHPFPSPLPTPLPGKINSAIADIDNLLASLIEEETLVCITARALISKLKAFPLVCGQNFHFPENKRTWSSLLCTQ